MDWLLFKYEKKERKRLERKEMNKGVRIAFFNFEQGAYIKL